MGGSAGECGGFGRISFDAMDGKGCGGTTNNVSVFVRGKLFARDGLLGLEGPDLPCVPGFGRGERPAQLR